MTVLAAVSLATNFELLICCLICQLGFISAYINFNGKRNSAFPWIILLILCLYYVWDTDYYTYLAEFQNGMVKLGQKEFIYKWLCDLTYPHYLLWRLLIWGTAILLYRHTSKRLGINLDTSIYVLILFDLTLFIYGRVNLAIALYTCGLSYLSKPNKSKIASYTIGCCLIISSFFAHRSFLPIIALTPLFLIPINKRSLILYIILAPVLAYCINMVFAGFADSSIQMNQSMESFQKSAERLSVVRSASLNWKAKLLYNVRNLSFFIPAIFIGIHLFFTKHRIKIERKMMPYFSEIFIIQLISFCMLYAINGIDTQTVAKRYLFMTGMPICLLLSYLYERNQLTKRTLNLMILLGFVSMEALFLMTYYFNGYNINGSM